MAKILSDAARNALAATGGDKLDAMTDEAIARQIATNPDAAPDMALYQIAVRLTNLTAI